MSEIAVGNIVGSNLFNLLAAFGVSAIAGGGIPVPDPAIAIDLPVSLLVTLVALPALALGLWVTRWEGGLLLAGYAGYVAYLVYRAVAPVPAPAAGLWLLAGLAGLAVLITAAGFGLSRTPHRERTVPWNP